LVKSLHSGDPDVIQTCGLARAYFTWCVTCKCYPGQSNCMLILNIISLQNVCAIHWGTHVQVAIFDVGDPDSIQAETYLSRGAP
jgi:hypothetical protein